VMVPATAEAATKVMQREGRMRRSVLFEIDIFEIDKA
jgi:hypothetical protein